MSRTATKPAPSPQKTNRKAEKQNEKANKKNAQQQGGANPAEKVICSMVGVTKRHEKKTVLENIHLSYFHGAKIGVLGLNGSGKSTLLKILAGVDKDYEGQVTFSPGYSVGYLEQEPQLDPDKTVREVVEEAFADTAALLREFETIGEKFSEPMDDDAMTKLLERQGEVQEKIDKAGGWDLTQQVEMASAALGLPDGEAKIGPLSGGERRRVALCRLLLKNPDVLILDEPTNHLDADAVAWLEHHLARYPGTVIAVTHDRYFLDNVAGWILELDRGRGYPYKGNYSAWLEQKAARQGVEAKQDDARKKAMATELEWIRSSPKARQTKSKARLAAYDAMVSEQVRLRPSEVELFIAPGPRLGNTVIEAENVAKGYDGRELFHNVTFRLPPGGIVGIVGPNGAGKTTLFRMITGDETADKGKLKVGDSVKLAYVEQSRDSLGMTDNVWQAISDGQEVLDLGPIQMNSRAFVARFGFTGTDQQKPVGSLSGGERNRVHLARMLKRGANVILLDEPTNDLDVNVIRALEEALLDFPGCAVVVSHDRYFLDRVATHILAFEGDGTATWFEGNYSSYAADRLERTGEEAFGVRRGKYRKLTKA